jgi:hypothetical protein
MSALVESYADVAVERWGRTMGADPRGGFGRRHEARSCGCLVCADGRDALGLIALKPLFARRSWPEARP